MKASNLREPLAAVVRVISSGGKTQRSARLGPQKLLLGAGSDCDVIIDDAAVSRHHLELNLAPEGVLIRDLKSRNGTFYNGQKVGELTLALGGSISVGETRLEFSADREDFEGTQGAALAHYGPLYGQSLPMKRLFTLLTRLEGSLVNVLIEGESGTGKELVARALHDASLVKSGPFVAINCGALDRSLVRSELFGHKKGAFTGAQSDSNGAFLDAHGGTLFLDEIGELPLDIQPILLRALESGTITRVGESRARPVKVRLICATHRHLKDDVREKLFRADLYYRLMVVTLAAPTLAERKEDVPLLAEKICESLGLTQLSPDVIDQLKRRSFPGNVRELKHAILAYDAIGELPESETTASSTALQDHNQNDQLRSFINIDRPYAEQKEALIDHMTRLYLQELLASCQGNRSEAARRAELQRGYLRRLLEKYGLD